MIGVPSLSTHLRNNNHPFCDSWNLNLSKGERSGEFSHYLDPPKYLRTWDMTP